MTNTFDMHQTLAEGMKRFAENAYPESIEHLSQVIEVEDTHRLARMARGSAYLKTSDTDKAIADFDHLIRGDQANARAFHLRGLAREMAGDDEGALSDVTRAIDLNPDYGAAYHSRSNLYSKLGREDLAMEDIQTLTALSQINMESQALENNVWRTHHMRVEAQMETELDR